MQAHGSREEIDVKKWGDFITFRDPAINTHLYLKEKEKEHMKKTNAKIKKKKNTPKHIIFKL